MTIIGCWESKWKKGIYLSSLRQTVWDRERFDRNVYINNNVKMFLFFSFLLNSFKQKKKILLPLLGCTSARFCSCYGEVKGARVCVCVSVPDIWSGIIMTRPVTFVSLLCLYLDFIYGPKPIYLYLRLKFQLFSS